MREEKRLQRLSLIVDKRRQRNGRERSWKSEEREGQQHLDLNWNERGGPPAEKPTSKGFGSRLIRMGLAGSSGSKLDYGPECLSASFEAPISDLTRS